MAYPVPDTAGGWVYHDGGLRAWWTETGGKQATTM